MDMPNDPSSPELMTQFIGGSAHINPVTRQEFALTISGDIYLCYNPFATVEDFARETKRPNPSRFEVGAIYNAEARDKRTLRAGALPQPLMRELVFDIEMTDYDSIRACCSGTGICTRCWSVIAAAVTALDSALRTEFGYRYLLWVYSGRPGIHCWGGAEMVKKVNVQIRTGFGAGPLPPSLKRSSRGKASGTEVLLSLIRTRLSLGHYAGSGAANPGRPSNKKFGDLNAEVTALGHSQGANSFARHKKIILQHLYPRIDAEVSKHRNHLLKSRFCVQPQLDEYVYLSTQRKLTNSIRRRFPLLEGC
ncbi:prim-pol domain-containing protein [Calocera cornea HHB12733]|uniref:DNA primase n=1 Tax=Calocera cornea HHB12733 TaxID=1353952 RepID=A0A165C3V7_9BASI|nr:prim-pol domain-containing protein [Calocera cornea HHB12733]